MSKQYGNLRIATAIGDTFSNVVRGDMLIYTETSNQKIMLGPVGGTASNPNIALTSNNTQVYTTLTPMPNTVDLGSSNNKFRDLYLSGNNLNLGNLRLQDSNNTLRISACNNGALTSIAVSNVNITGNILQNGVPFSSSVPGLSNTNNTVYILSGSNFGVGTSSVNSEVKLQVSGSVYSESNVLGNSNSTSNAPSFSWINDTTTGMYAPSRGMISFTSGGTDVATLSNDGLNIASGFMKIANINRIDNQGQCFFQNIRFHNGSLTAGTSNTLSYVTPTLSNNTVNSNNIIDGCIIASKLATSAITSNAIATSNVTASKLGGIEAFVIGTGSNSYIGLSNSNQLYGIGKSNPSFKLDVSGDIYATGNVTAFSDERFKVDISVISNALDKVKSISGYTFTSINDNKRYAGVLAQQIQTVLPEVVSTNNEGYLSVAYGNISALLIQAIKELSGRIDALESRI